MSGQQGVEIWPKQSHFEFLITLQLSYIQVNGVRKNCIKRWLQTCIDIQPNAALPHSFPVNSGTFTLSLPGTGSQICCNQYATLHVSYY